MDQNFASYQIGNKAHKSLGWNGEQDKNAGQKTQESHTLDNMCVTLSATSLKSAENPMNTGFVEKERSRALHKRNNPKKAFQQLKKYNLRLAIALEKLGDSRSKSVGLCAMTVIRRWCNNCEFEHYSGQMTCQHRLCPICQVKRSRRLGADATKAVGYLDQCGKLEDVSMYLLTLTQRNVVDGDLGCEIDRIQSALGRLVNVKEVRRNLLGSARNVEVTRNYSQYTWHPHIHMILMVRNGSPLATKSYWQELWMKLVELDYVPEVDIRPISSFDSVYEVSKYVAKSTELLENLRHNELVSVIGELNNAIRKRRLITYTGIWREARKACKISDNADADADGDGRIDKCCKCGQELMNAVMIWNGNKYVLAPSRTKQR